MDILTSFKKLKKRERLLLIGLSFTLAASLYFLILYRPLSRKITRLKAQTRKSQLRLDEIKTTYPQIEQQQQAIGSLEAECQVLADKIFELEQVLPEKNRTVKLLATLTSKAGDLKFESIRQRVDYGQEYSRIFIELKFNASYKETANFIRSIESISPFLTIEELEIAEPAKGARKTGGILTRLVVASLLGETPAQEAIKTEEEHEIIELSRDIFVSEARPVSQIQVVDLRLDGITYNSRMPTAIINGEVTKEGSQVANLEVKEINPENVILTDGREDHILAITR
ncbi:type 4a pilus biogenesis protein PilO [Candidatus Omnitrophota bacterium]